MSKEKVSSKTLGELTDDYRYNLNDLHLKYSGMELIEEISKLQKPQWIQVEGLVAELKKRKSDVKADWESENCKGWYRDKEQQAFYRGQNSAYDEFLVLLDFKEQKKETKP